MPDMLATFPLKANHGVNSFRIPYYHPNFGQQILGCNFAVLQEQLCLASFLVVWISCYSFKLVQC
ncbi:hypothetical protein CANTEDRAFT_118566 [Yamadazyma tenuis ATCC 10573]|uniref:Uncharacterized protein n=1 Tax=Candida tenuis (strain ATCC 10573 / BCRC 21748 / CBS 615 / JCM 9827 / NBRC 10315 / NRRL Y-1498 / VKM Y-70) TaxID=590646 RepID=G3AYC5_CANTC|nr:uncharacterized protein CANTEDRAFT_118566 [Yamadazyma tenuis ATCC 10573]EGV65818.1 hypothetical protein CANTEDRAFT_118566 [Yamadazyma tenuis ATCC 10573]